MERAPKSSARFCSGYSERLEILGGATMILRTARVRPIRSRLANIALAVSLAVFATAAIAADDCHVGAYRLGDGRIVDIAPSEGPTLRWRMLDGETGALAVQPDGSWRSTFGWTGGGDGRKVIFSDCTSGSIDFAGVSGKRIPLQVTETSFNSAGVTLVGRLVLPPGRRSVPIVVLIHGAEHNSAREFNFLQRLLPAEGVGAFVYDKRGTGGSSGEYTQDYPTLATDAVAALREARRLAGPRTGRVGYQGGSQGGWVAPLAAKDSPVDFVIVSFGLAVSPLAEERELIEHEVRSHVPGPRGGRIADEFADAIKEVAKSSFRDFDRLDAVRQHYSREPWFKQVGGEFARFLLDTPDAEIRKRRAAADQRQQSKLRAHAGPEDSSTFRSYGCSAERTAMPSRTKQATALRSCDLPEGRLR